MQAGGFGVPANELERMLQTDKPALRVATSRHRTDPGTLAHSSLCTKAPESPLNRDLARLQAPTSAPGH